MLLGWNSLSSVIEIHASLEGAALISFAALVVFDVLAHLNKKREILFERIGLVCFGIAVLAEICAYPYSRRIDTLSAEATAAAEGKIAALNKEAGDARRDGEQLKKDNLVLQGEVLKLHERIAPRDLTAVQQLRITRACSH